VGSGTFRPSKRKAGSRLFFRRFEIWGATGVTGIEGGNTPRDRDGGLDMLVALNPGQTSGQAMSSHYRCSVQWPERVSFLFIWLHSAPS
jgi:hypothetical protein